MILTTTLNLTCADIFRSRSGELLPETAEIDKPLVAIEERICFTGESVCGHDNTTPNVGCSDGGYVLTFTCDQKTGF